MSRNQFISTQPLHHSISFKREDGINYITNKTEDHSHFISYPIDDQTENNDAYGKRPNTCPEKFASLHSIKPEILRPKIWSIYKERARDKRKRRGD